MAKSPSTPAEAAAEPSSIAQFEQSLDELEQLVAKMEGGELSLDESLRSFERGIALFRNCQNALEQAELRVKLLLDPDDPTARSPSIQTSEHRTRRPRRARGCRAGAGAADRRQRTRRPGARNALCRAGGRQEI